MPVPSDPPAGESIYDQPPPPFQPLKPEVVQPTSSSPAPSNDPGTFGGTSGEDDEAAPQEQAQAEEALPEFDPRYRDAFTGLLYLGRLTKPVSLWGHTFVIKTLTTEENAEIGLYCARYDGTRAQNAVYQTAVVAAAVVSLDGQPLPEPLGPTLNLQARIDYVMQNWMPPVRERIFEEVFSLEEQVRTVLDEMGKVSG